MVYADLTPAFPRRILPELSLSNIESAKKLIPAVATTLAPDQESVTNTQTSVEGYFSRWENSVKALLFSRLARKNFHIPFPQPDQEKLHDVLELTTLHQRQLFEVILDQTGSKAKKFRPTHADIELVSSLVNPHLPDNSPALSPLGRAFDRYAPKHTQDFMVIAPTLLLELMGAAHYQSHAPYAGLINQQTSSFYEHYFRSVPPELATNNNPSAYTHQAQIEAFERMLHFKDFNIAFFGIGNGYEKLIDEHIRTWRESPNVTRMFSNANQKIKRIGFDILPRDDVAPWLDEYHQLSLDQLYQHPELRGLVSQIYSFGSVYMDILEVVKYLQGLLGASHILKRGGRFSDDQSLPATYAQEISAMHSQHPQEPYGLFWREWRTGETNPPGKLFYAMPLNQRYFYYHLAGLKPESLQYSDAIYLEHLIRENPELLSSSQSTIRSRPWLKHALNSYYQTTDAHGRVSHRTTLTLIKNRHPLPILALLTNFLARTPAFAPKPEK